jgi:bifunctional non-homologous end joining protein LigD
MQVIHIKPQLATLSAGTPNTDDWLHEVKYDGYRIIAVIKNNSVKLYTRNQHDWTDKFPKIAKSLEKLPDCILDGELIALHNGISDFELLQNEISNSKSKNIYYKIFDIMYYRNDSMLEIPLIERKEKLASIFKKFKSKYSAPTEYIIGQGEKVFKNACKLGLEGIISKQLDSVYQQKRTQTWLKSKCVHEQEFVIAGYTQPKGAREHFGSLILGYYKNKQLIYCGHVGTGFTEKKLTDIFAKMKKIVQDKSPFKQTPHEIKNEDVTWIKPKLVANIRYIEQTRKGILRAPSFLGLRLDKTAKQVTQEVPITLTHPKTVLKTTGRVTKEQMAEYYGEISQYILPHLKNRPLSLLRCPATGTKCFFQKNITTKDLASLNKIIIQKAGKKIHYVCANKKSDLIHLAQAGALELHPWGSKKDAVEKPDRIVFDLDPGQRVEWSQVIKGAFYLRKFLQQLGLKSFVKTSGGKGLHIVIPILRKYTWPDIKLFSQTVALAMAKEYPDLFTAKMGETNRQGKIFIDYLRNVRGATAVAAYSLRAHIDAPISTPVSWDELKKIKSSAQFNIFNIKQRLAKLKSDPWAGFFTTRQSLNLGRH